MRRVLISLICIIILQISGSAQCWKQAFYHGDSLSMLDVHFMSLDTGIVGLIENTLYVTYDGGESWSNLDDDSNTHYWYNALIIDDETIIISEGIDDIFKSNDFGDTWEDISIPPSEFLGSVIANMIFLDKNTGWVCDKTGSIFYTSDGGEHWVPKYRDAELDKDYFLCRMQMVTDSVFWIAAWDMPTGDDGILLTSQDGTDTWIEYDKSDISGLADFRPEDVFFLNDSIGWISGGGPKILKTTDGGQVWFSINLPGQPENFRGERIQFLDENRGWMLDYYDNQMLVTNDGGQNWIIESSVATSGPGIYAMDFQMLNDTTGFWVDRKGRIYTYQGGPPDCASFMTEPSFAELNISLLPTLEWSATPGCLGGYRIQLGTTDGGDELLPLTDVSQNRSYTVSNPLPENTQVYLTIVPYNVAGGNADACDSYFFRTLSCSEPVMTFIDTILCEGEQLLIADSLLTSPGDYMFPLLAVNGCDSIVQLSLDYSPTYSFALNAAVCPDEPLLFGDSLLTAPGEYIFSFGTELGCDSIILLNLAQLETSSTQVDTSVLSGSTLFGQMVFSDTIVVTTYIAANGCDSTVTFQVQIITDVREVVAGFRHFVVPNPSQGQVPRLQAVLPFASEATLVILDAQGRVVSRKRLHLFAAVQRVLLSEMQAQAAGLYFYHLRVKDRTLTGKFIIQ